MRPDGDPANAERPPRVGSRPAAEAHVAFAPDNGNVVLDLHNLAIVDPVAMEAAINRIPGVLFAHRAADAVIVGRAPPKLL